MGKFDGLALAVDRPRTCALVNPITRQPLRDGDGNEAFISLYSVDAEPARQHRLEASRRRLNTRGTVSPEELEADSVALLAALTAGWHLVALDGSPIDVPFSAEAARELYAEPSLAWIREQVDAFASSRANFGKASSTS